MSLDKEIVININTRLKGLENSLNALESSSKKSGQTAGKGIAEGVKSAEAPVKKSLINIQNLVKGYLSFKGLQMLGRSITSAFSGGIEAMAAQEQVTIQLSSALKMVGEDVEKTVPVIQKYSSEMQNLYGYGNELIEQHTARMTRALGNSSDAMNVVQRAMHISRESGQDFSKVVNDINTALETGSARGMKDYIVGVEELQNELRGAHTTSEKYSIILGKINSQFGQEIPESTKLAQDRMREAYADLVKAIGGGEAGTKTMQNALTELTSLINNSLIPATEKFFGDWWAGVGRMTRAMQRLGGRKDGDSEQGEVLEDVRSRFSSQLIEAQLSGNQELVEKLSKAIERTDKEIIARDERRAKEEAERQNKAIVNQQKTIEKSGQKVAEIVEWKMSEAIKNQLILERKREEYREQLSQEERASRIAYNEGMFEAQQQAYQQQYELQLSHQQRIEEQHLEHINKIANLTSEGFQQLMNLHSTWSSDSTNTFGKVAGSVSSLAPTIGALAPIPGGAAIGQAVGMGASFLGQVFGREDNKNQSVTDRPYKDREVQFRRTAPENVYNTYQFNVSANNIIGEKDLDDVAKKLQPALKRVEARSL